MRLAIVILNWNQLADTAVCIQACTHWLHPEDQIWVVDNGSEAAEQAQLQQAVGTASILWSGANLGFGGGNNLGLQAAIDGEFQYVLLLNNDARLAETAVAQLIHTLDQQPEIGMIGPEIWDGDRLLSAGGKDIAQALATHHSQPMQPGELRQVAYVPGTCIFMRTAVLQKIGLLDEAYFFGGEVADLCTRARQAGYQCAILGGTQAQHQLERSAEQRHQLHIYYVLRNRFLFVQKFRPQQKTRLYLFWSWQIARLWLHALLTRNWARARAVALAGWDGWNGRFGGQNARVTKGEIA
ncbi:MAG: glycosyltransferase [Anaerolineales bacterium]|nr:glycosyltransferase [Anaerolineales bacterium]